MHSGKRGNLFSGYLARYSSLFYWLLYHNRNRLISEGHTPSALPTPKQRLAQLYNQVGGIEVATNDQSNTTPAQGGVGGGQTYRRPKNISLLDQLNRIDMVGFHRFVEAITSPRGPDGSLQSSPSSKQRFSGIGGSLPIPPRGGSAAQSPRQPRKTQTQRPHTAAPLAPTPSPPAFSPSKPNVIHPPDSLGDVRGPLASNPWTAPLDEASIGKPSSSQGGQCKSCLCIPSDFRL